MKMRGTRTQKQLPMVQLHRYHLRKRPTVQLRRHRQFNSLPPEIISTIFKYLPLEDRRNVRLTSKLWNACCNCSPVTKNEKFVFRRNDKTRDIKRILQNPDLRVMNLEFQGMLMSRIPKLVWKLCANRVHSIVFYWCTIDERTIKNVLHYCTNLNSLEIYAPFCTMHTIFEVVDYFMKENITYAALCNLALISCPFDATGLLKMILFVFPNLRQLNTNFFSLREILECSQLPSQLNLQTHWLTKFETHIVYGESNFNYVTKEIILHFFNMQTNLKSLSFTIDIVSSRRNTIEWTAFGKQLFFHILKNCSHICELVFGCASEVQLTEEEAKDFLVLISKLQVLVLKSSFRNADSLPMLPIVLGMNVLSFKSSPTKNVLPEFILKHTQNVQHLELIHPTDRLLQIVSNTMPNLETLRLKDLRACTKLGFFGSKVGRNRQLFINRLNQLEYLDIDFKILKSKTAGNIIREIKLPHLKSLTLSGVKPGIPKAALRSALCRMYNLTYLHLGNIEPRNFYETLKLCAHMEKLKYFTVDGISSLNCSPKSIFTMLRSLRFFRLTQCHQVYEHNPLDNINENCFAMLDYYFRID